MTDKYKHIHNGEDGLSVRNKLNSHADRLNELEGVEVRLENHQNDHNNPHKVIAPQVDLEPVLQPLGPDDQNVQGALEWLYDRFTEHNGGDWHLTHIDGNYVYIEIKHGPRSEFPPTILDLELAELKINHDDGQLWTRLSDDTIVKIGDKDLITEAPLDGRLYGRMDGEWHTVTLATVSDNIPDNPTEGDIWVDTRNTMELYVFIGGSGWVSMTGAGGGAGGSLPDNVVLDDVDGTLYDKLLGREISEDGSGVWRPIYSSDVIPADGASPMTRADGSVLRNQADINKFLYESIGEGAVDGDWVPVSGGAFEGPIFGPSMPAICDSKHPVSSDFPNDKDENVLDDLSCKPGGLVVQARTSFNPANLDGDIQNRFKIRPVNQYQLQQWADGNDATLLFVENRGDGRLHMQVHEVEGGPQYHLHPDGYGVLYGESQTCRGSVISGGWPTYVYKVGDELSPYVTMELLKKIGESGELYVPAQGGEFTGPIFGPSVDNLNSDNPSVLAREQDPHLDPTCPEGQVVVQTTFAYDTIVNGAQQRLKLHIASGAEKYCDQPDIEYALVQPSGAVQILVCENSGFATDSGTVLNVEAQTCYGDDLVRGRPTQVWRTSVDASPYMTLEMFKKLATTINVPGHAHVGPNPPLSLKDGVLWFDTNPDVMELFIWHEDAQQWEPCKQDSVNVPDGPDLGDLLWEEVDPNTGTNPALTLQITHPSRPTQNGSKGTLHLWHGDPAQCTTSPEQEFKVWMSDGGQSIIDKYAADGFAPEFEIRQGDKAMRFKSNSGGWITGGNTYHASCSEVTGDILTDGPCEWWIRYDDSKILDILDDMYVNKEGGDFMQGPLEIRRQDDGGDSRDTNRINTLGVYSGSDNSALRLGIGEKSDKIYVGKNDTSFNGPVKINEITERNDGDGVTLASTLNFDSSLDTLMKLNPEVGGTQEISLFGNGQDKIIKVDIQGATYKNAIEFESGSSASREVIFRIDSNKGINVKDLKAWNTRIQDLADPIEEDDAVNLRSVQAAVGDLESRIRDRFDSLITENNSGQMEYANTQYPMSAGKFNTWTLNGQSSTSDPFQTREVWAHEDNLSGYSFEWDDLRPNTYMYMSGPEGIFVRFRVVAEPVYVSANKYYKIKVNDALVSPDWYKFWSGDAFNVLFLTVSGGTANLDDYLPIDGSKAMTGELAAHEKVSAKIPKDGTQFETATFLAEGYRSGDGADAARLTLSNGYNQNAYATINYRGTSNNNGLLTFDRAKVEVNRYGTNKDGFTLKGRSNVGGVYANDNKLLSVYHGLNSGANSDAVNYYGKQENDNNLSTVGHTKTTLRNAFGTLQRAVADEDTVEGIKTALTNALGGLIEELEHEE